jgi:hypothetical protein
VSKVVTTAWYKQDMRRRSAVLRSLLLASIMAGAATAAQSASSAKPTLITTVGAVETLAMDGRRVAYDLEARSACNTLHVWDTVSKLDVVVSGSGTCGADSTSTGAGVREIAVAGRRVSWIVNLGGNTESADTLYAATVGGAKERKLASALRTGDVDGVLNGTWIGNLAGDGDLTALNRWKTDDGSVIAASVDKLRVGVTTVHAGTDSLRVMSVDSGRIAVLDPQGAVTIYAANGSIVSSFEPNGEAKELALRKDFAVVLVPGALEVWNATTGALVDTIAVSHAARSLDVHANVAAFVVGKSIRAIRIATKKRATVAVAPNAVVDLQIDDAGLVYAYNPVTGVKGIGKLAFVPLSLVQLKTA